MAIEGPSPQNSTAQNGQIVFTGLRDGDYKITVSCAGYETASAQIMISSSGKSEYMKFFRIKRIGATPAKEESKTEAKTEKPVVTVNKLEQAEKPREPVKIKIPAPVVKNNEKEVVVKPESPAKQPKAVTEKEPEPPVKSGQPIVAGKKPLFAWVPSISLKWKFILGAIAFFSCFMAFVSLIVLAVMWKKSSRAGKIIFSLGSLGCGFVAFAIIAILVLSHFPSGLKYKKNIPSAVEDGKEISFAGPAVFKDAAKPDKAEAERFYREHASGDHLRQNETEGRHSSREEEFDSRTDFQLCDFWRGNQVWNFNDAQDAGHKSGQQHGKASSFVSLLRRRHGHEGDGTG